ncbi:winged helix-turn-helix transcriptional regulator [Aquimarina longa]|uniref:winged helix-turn-helix transcriptional regulator n=1 Tax=Aquimarina longa TaxID=1080221 RepID=UPI00078145A6|nr:helix-turn-helix domain-containing protein [Aquimarina longa]
MNKIYGFLENEEDLFTSCPVMTTLEVIGGKWKPAILWQLENNEFLRFGQLKKRLGVITQKMLTQQLRELETNNIILRKIYPEVPPRVEYRLSEYGKSLVPVLNEMANWGLNHNKAKIK